MAKAGVAAPTTARRPNILFIMADQFRHDWMRCSGADFVRTPNLDALASRGVRFTHCFTNSPICVPARIGLATGLQPMRVGALGNDAFAPLSVPTYYQRLRDAGYHVGLVGKLDLAKPDIYNGVRGDRPITYANGFTHPVECEGKMHAGFSPTPIGPYTQYLHEKGLLEQFHKDYRQRAAGGYRDLSDSVLEAEDYEDTYIGRRSIEWLQTVPRDFPFHLFVSFVGPHDPFDPPTEYARRYRGAAMPNPFPAATDSRPRWVEQRARRCPSGDEVLEARRQYSASVELIDEQIGLILRTLEAQGLADNTYVVFASDHGEMLGDHGCFRKHLAYESALRVPLVVAGPGIAGGRVSDALVELIDVGAAICQLAGAPMRPEIDARSFTPLLHGQTDTHRDDVIAAEQNYRAIRTRQYKLIHNHNDLDELYDLEADPTEQRNLIDVRPEVIRELRQRMKQRFLEGQWMR